MAKQGIGLTAGLRLAGQDNVRRAAQALGELSSAERQVALLLAANGAVAGSGAAETATEAQARGKKKASRWTPAMRAAQAKRIKAALAKKKRGGKSKSSKGKAPTSTAQSATTGTRTTPSKAATSTPKPAPAKPNFAERMAEARAKAKAKKAPAVEDEELEVDESGGG
jgi:hypothetical protein